MDRALRNVSALGRSALMIKMILRREVAEVGKGVKELGWASSTMKVDCWDTGINLAETKYVAKAIGRFWRFKVPFSHG